MRWSRWIVSLEASLAGIAAGTLARDESETEPRRTPALGFATSGFSVSGPNFYVWDENARQTRRWAAELSLIAPLARRKSGSDEPRIPHPPTL